MQKDKIKKEVYWVISCKNESDRVNLVQWLQYAAEHSDALKSLVQLLENCKEGEQNVPVIVESEGRDEDNMAKEHRLRIRIGYTEDGEPVIRQLSARSELELGEKVLRAFVQSGRIREFFPQLSAPQQPEAKPTKAKRTNFKAYSDYWRKTYKQGKAKNTEVFIDSKQSVLNDWFGGMNIEEITSGDVQKFLNARAKKCKKATVKADWGMLKEILDSAVNDEIIAKNPAKDRRLTNIAAEGSGTASLTREQIISIQRAIPMLEDPREKCLIALLAYTSMRREEVLGLRWQNVDFAKRRILICEAVVFPVSTAVKKATKTKSSVRHFPMCDQLYEILWSCRREFGYVISKENGEPVTAMTYRRLWERLQSHIELYGMTAKNFRTTFATMMVASGVDIKTTQSLMGHSTPEMTLKVYAKTEPTRLPAAVETLGNFLSDAAT